MAWRIRRSADPPPPPLRDVSRVTVATSRLRGVLLPRVARPARHAQRGVRRSAVPRDDGLWAEAEVRPGRVSYATLPRAGMSRLVLRGRPPTGALSSLVVAWRASPPPTPPPPSSSSSSSSTTTTTSSSSSSPSHQPRLNARFPFVFRRCAPPTPRARRARTRFSRGSRSSTSRSARAHRRADHRRQARALRRRRALETNAAEQVTHVATARRWSVAQQGGHTQRVCLGPLGRQLARRRRLHLDQLLQVGGYGSE